MKGQPSTRPYPSSAERSLIAKDPTNNVKKEVVEEEPEDGKGTVVDALTQELNTGSESKALAVEEIEEDADCNAKPIEVAKEQNVTIFNGGAFSGETTTFNSANSADQRLLAKESQFHLFQLEEENKLKKVLNLEKESDPELDETHTVSDVKCQQKQTGRDRNSDSAREMTLHLNAEMIEKQVLEEFEVAKRTAVDELKQELNTGNESNAPTVKTPIVDAEKATKITMKNYELQKSVQPSVIEHLQVRKELQSRIFIRNLERQCEDKLLNLQEMSQKEQNDPQRDIICPQKQNEWARNLDVDSARQITSELTEESLKLEDVLRLLQSAEDKRQAALAELAAKHMKRIQNLEGLLADAIADRRFLELELERVKKENSELNDKVIETEFIREKLLVKLRQTVSELEASRSREAKGKYSYVKMMDSKLQQISLEVELARKEQNEIAEDLKKELAATKIALEEVENKVKAEAKGFPHHSIRKTLSKAVSTPAFRKFIRVCRIGVALWNSCAFVN